jgi:predicted permease
MAVRAALGATRGRLVRELAAEASVLGLGAGALGVGVAFAAVPGLHALAPQWLPRLNQMGVDWRVVAFCAVTSLITVFVFGVFPAWQTSRGNLAEFLKEGGRATGSAQRYGLQDGLVALQVAVALVLLTGAGLLVESFARFERVDPGFRTDGLLTADINMPNPPYGTPERQAVFVRSVEERLGALPGVISASTSDGLPGLGGGALSFSIIGDPPPGQNEVPTAWTVAVSPEYFRTIGIQLRRGRGVLPTDDYRATKIAVIDETMVKRFFQDRDPIGRRFTFAEVPDTVQVVGVVTAVKQGGPTAEDRPELYVPMAQFPTSDAFLLVRTSGPPEGETRLLKQAIADLDRSVPLSDVMTIRDRMVQSVGTTRFASVLASLFAVVALVLGAVGIYSVLAYIVTQRRREIAVRIALGASHRDVMSDVLRRALLLTGIGIVIGSAAAWMLTRALAGLFFGVSPHDPGVFVGAAVVFGLVALAAAFLPAFRTTRINPVVALTSP